MMMNNSLSDKNHHQPSHEDNGRTTPSSTSLSIATPPPPSLSHHHHHHEEKDIPTSSSSLIHTNINNNNHYINNTSPIMIPLAGFKPGFIAQNKCLSTTTTNNNNNNNSNHATTTTSLSSAHTIQVMNPQTQQPSPLISTRARVVVVASDQGEASQESLSGAVQQQHDPSPTIEGKSVGGGPHDFHGSTMSLSVDTTSSQQPRMACTHYKLHPCGECKRRGLQHECVFSEPKKRGPKLRISESEEATVLNVSSSPTLKQTPPLLPQQQRKSNEPKKRKFPNDHSQTAEITSPTSATTQQAFKLAPNQQYYSTADMFPLSGPGMTQQLYPPLPTYFSTMFEDALLGRKEIDRRNYLLQMVNISLSHNFDNNSNMYQIEPSLDYVMQLFFREDFIHFVVECLDNNHRDMLKIFIRERVLLWIQQRVMSETFYQGIYYAFEALFLKYHCLFKLSIYDDNRSILLSESEKSIKQCKKELFKFMDSAQIGNVEKSCCFMWASFFNQILDGNNELSATLSRCALEKVQNDITIQMQQHYPIISEFLNIISKQYLLFTKYLLCSDIQQDLYKLQSSSSSINNASSSFYFKRLILKALQLTFVFRYTSSYPYLFLGEFERLVKNHDTFSPLTIQPAATTSTPASSSSDNMIVTSKTVRQTLLDMDCCIPRTTTECWSFLAQVNQQVISTNSPDILFWQFLIQYLKTRMVLTGFSPQSQQQQDLNFEQMNHNLVCHLKAIMDTCFGVSPVYLFITLICVRDLLLNLSSSIPSSAKEDYKKFMTHLTTSTREGNHMRACGNLFTNPQKEDIIELLNIAEQKFKI
nr:unnamed protein product [Naegleria fowleri]